MLLISIDGACRRNGKPDCVSAGGVFIQQYVDSKSSSTSCLSSYEINSTSQRGELTALKLALQYIQLAKQDAQIVTDSEYLFNAITNEWFVRWNKTGWQTAMGEAVKNQDLWQDIAALYEPLKETVSIYHIKGHVIPFGKVTAMGLLAHDTSGGALMNAVQNKFDAERHSLRLLSKLESIQELSKKNNGFALSDELLCRFVCANVVVDSIATRVVETADAVSN